ncbi:MAG: PAS domain S-box protein, partial [Anaerolineales bacterium]|nr:PAS domain S-box protein [Anaerolineales bacterium]
MKNTVGLAIIGLIFGLLIVVFATLVALFTTGTPITLENIVSIQLTTPLLWIIDTFPIFLVVILGMLGSREDRLQRVLREGRIAHKRATDLQQLNVELAEQAQEHQELEAIISHGKKEWEATFDSVEDMILITDEEGIINRCNRITTRTFQKDFLQIIGKRVDDLFFGDSASERERLPVDKMEMRFPTLAGWYEVSSSSLVYDGTRQGRIYIVRNVTDRKQASLDMQRQKQYYETLVRNSPIAIVTLSLDHRLVACNPAFEELFGFRQSEILGQDLDNLISPTDLVEETQSLTERVKGGEVVHKITRRLSKDGSTIDVELFGIPVVLWGKQIGIFGLYHDVTDLVRAQE